jgi:putative acetyltransferase
VIREETPADVTAIHAVNVAAFETDAEARLVDALRAAGALTLSLVAEIEGAIVGHIAFSPVTLTSGQRTVAGVGLAPMAVVPAQQRSGIGGKLVQEGLRRLRDAGHPFCVVLGHADYYPRHGFLRASSFGIRWEHPVPDEVFFVQELTPGGLQGLSGTIRYRPELDAV